MVRKLVDRVFDGAADRLVAHLVEGGQLSTDQLADLGRLIDRQAREKPTTTARRTRRKN